MNIGQARPLPRPPLPRLHLHYRQVEATADSLRSSIYNTLHQHYRNDFRLFWMRTNFFLLVNAGLLGFISSTYFAGPDQVFSRTGIIVAAQALSIVWFLASRSALTWIEVWREEIVLMDRDLNPYETFSRGERDQCNQGVFHLLFRPETIASYLPFVFQVLWFLIAMLPILEPSLRRGFFALLR